jgi:hypothetical protein
MNPRLSMRAFALLPVLVAACAAGLEPAGTGAAASPTPGAPSSAVADAPIDPVFDCFRINYAWGFVLQGSVIDRTGTIYRYRMRERDRSPRPLGDDHAQFYATGALQAKFAGAERSGSVDADALAAHIALAGKSAAGEITRTDTGTRDAGSSTCHAYLPEPARRRYRDVMLGSDGAAADTRLTNSAPEAAQLLDWLRAAGVAQ